MDVTTDKAMAECFHSVGQDIPADCLDNIFRKLRPVTFDAFPLLSVAGSFVGDRLTTELVLFDLRLYIGKPPAGRKLNKKHTFLVVEINAMCPFDVIIGFVPTIVRAKRMDDNLIEIEYDTDLYEVPDCHECFTISNNTIVAVAKSGSRILQLTTANTLVSVGSWTVTYNGLGGINSYHSECCKPEFGSFSVLATGEPPSVSETIEPTLSLTSISFIQCTFSSVYGDEKVSAVLSIVAVDLIKVGTNPL